MSVSVRPYKGSKDKWFVDIRLGAKDRIQKVFTGTHEEAVMYELHVKKLMGRPAFAKATVGGIAGEYLTWLSDHRSAKTHKDQKRMLYASLLSYFGPMYPDMIDKRTIHAYQNQRKAEVHHGSAKGGLALINKEILCLSALVRWAQENGYCNDILVKYDKLPYHRPLPVVLSPDEMARFLEAAEPFWRVLFLVPVPCWPQKRRGIIAYQGSRSPRRYTFW